jgi:hypothetical protein
MDEMGRDPNLADEELQALLDGHPAASADLVRFVDDLRATFPAGAPATETHLAAMMDATHLFADNGDPVVRPASNAVAPASQVSRLPKRRENRMKDRNWRILVLRVAAPIVALFTVLGIMGSAGALPRGLQRLTSHAAGVVGFDLPTGDEDEGADDQGENLDDQGEDTGKDDSTSVGENDQGDDAVSADDQGDNNDDQGDSVSSDPTDENSQGDSTVTDEGDQGDNNDDQGDSVSSDQGNQDDQGDSVSGDQGNQDDQGDSVSGDQGNQDDQGDSSDDSSSNDSGSGGSGSGDNQN